MLMMEVGGIRLEAKTSFSEFIMKTQASAKSSLYINSRRGVPSPHASTNTLEVAGLRSEGDASQIEDLGRRSEATTEADEPATLMANLDR